MRKALYNDARFAREECSECLSASCRDAADLQRVAKGSLMLQANGCDDGKLQGPCREHVGGIPGASEPRLYDGDVNLQGSKPDHPVHLACKVRAWKSVCTHLPLATLRCYILQRCLQTLATRPHRDLYGNN